MTDKATANEFEINRHRRMLPMLTMSHFCAYQVSFSIKIAFIKSTVLSETEATAPGNNNNYVENIYTLKTPP